MLHNLTRQLTEENSLTLKNIFNSFYILFFKANCNPSPGKTSANTCNLHSLMRNPTEIN